MAKILFFGAGAIGGYLGAHLHNVGHDVSFIIRPQSVEKLQTDGLSLTESDGSRIAFHPPAFGSVADAVQENEYDVIIVCTKSHHLKQVIDALRADYPDFPHIIPTQNGIDTERLFIDAFGRERVTVGSVTAPVIRNGYDLIVEGKARGIAMSPAEKGVSVTKWRELFAGSGVNTLFIENYESMKWSKALLNIMGNAISAILDMNPQDIYRNRALFEIEMGMLREAMEVMKIRGIPVKNLPGVSARYLELGVRYLPTFITQKILISEIKRGRGNKLPSFHIDLWSGEPESEIEFHNSAVVRAAQEINFPTPINQFYSETLLGLVNKEIPLHTYQKEPRKFISAIQ